MSTFPSKFSVLPPRLGLSEVPDEGLQVLASDGAAPRVAGGAVRRAMCVLSKDL